MPGTAHHRPALARWVTSNPRASLRQRSGQCNTLTNYLALIIGATPKSQQTVATTTTLLAADDAIASSLRRRTVASPVNTQSYSDHTPSTTPQLWSESMQICSDSIGNLLLPIVTLQKLHRFSMEHRSRTTITSRYCSGIGLHQRLPLRNSQEPERLARLNAIAVCATSKENGIRLHSNSAPRLGATQVRSAQAAPPFPIPLGRNESRQPSRVATRRAPSCDANGRVSW